ncbi:MAG: hypothetical protein WAM73_02635 [Desulfobacterales bacterium]
MDTIASYTKYGEKRIKNCRKYDLGCGYRLITLQRGAKVFIPFFGTHDECQRWLEGNSRLKNFVPGNGTLFRIPYENQLSATPACENDGACKDDADDELLRKLTDKVLRHIFSGLVEVAEKRRRATKPGFG